MKTNYTKLLTVFASIAGFTTFSLLATLSSEASVKAASEIEKGNTKGQQQVAQKSGGGTLNPRPSIFNEPPYNRGGSVTPSETEPSTPSTTPDGQPTTPPTETPSTETPTTTPPSATDNQDKNLLALAESNASFTTLTKALKAAGLTGALQGKDNLTIFAPTDAAFAKLPQDALQELLKPDNKEVLIKILTYHVVPGKVLSTDLKSGEVKSLEGGIINVKVDPATGVTVNDAKVTQADITGSNGVIHAIDQVILPPDL